MILHQLHILFLISKRAPGHIFNDFRGAEFIFVTSNIKKIYSRGFKRMQNERRGLPNLIHCLYNTKTTKTSNQHVNQGM